MLLLDKPFNESMKILQLRGLDDIDNVSEAHARSVNFPDSLPHGIATGQSYRPRCPKKQFD
jgi:hypothetical protein